MTRTCFDCDLSDADHHRLVSAVSASRPCGAVCPVCSRQYSNKQTLRDHMDVHQGRTTCHICGKVLCIVRHLRRHLAQDHHLGPEEVLQLVPAATKGRQPMT